MIRIGNLAIVEVTAILRAKGFRRIVWTVRIIKVQPQKKRAPRSFFQPRNRMRYTFSGATVHQADIFFFKSLRRKCVVVKAEAARQSPTTVENKGADHGSSGVTFLLKGLGYRSKLWS